VELFIIWCKLSGTSIDTGAFIIRYLEKVARTTHKNALSIGGMITAISQALGDSDKFTHLEPHFLGDHLDIDTLHHMTIIENKGGTIWYPHHKQILFTLPNVKRTTVSNNRN